MNISSQLLKNHIYQKCHRPFLQKLPIFYYIATIPKHTGKPEQLLSNSLYNFSTAYNYTWLSDFKVTHIFHKLGVNNISYQTISLLFVAVCRILMYNMI